MDDPCILYFPIEVSHITEKYWKHFPINPRPFGFKDEASGTRTRADKEGKSTGEMRCRGTESGRVRRKCRETRRGRKEGSRSRGSIRGALGVKRPPRRLVFHWSRTDLAKTHSSRFPEVLSGEQRHEVDQREGKRSSEVDQRRSTDIPEKSTTPLSVPGSHNTKSAAPSDTRAPRSIEESL
jgi:hypothetical protein